MDCQTTFSAKLDALRPVLHWIKEQLAQTGFDEAALRKIELASEEAIVNVIRHGYEGREGKIQVAVAVTSPFEVKITIIDQGPPFNPLEHDVIFDFLAPLQEIREGGLGLLFMKQYMDEIHYERKGRSNVLTMTKRG